MFDKQGGDTTNGGVTSPKRGFTQLIMIGETVNGFCMVDEGPYKGYPLVRLVTKHGIPKLIPVELDGKWSMFGGNFAFSSDSRFSEAVEKLLGHSFGGAVKVFDRTEG